METRLWPGFLDLVVASKVGPTINQLVGVAYKAVNLISTDLAIITPKHYYCLNAVRSHSLHQECIMHVLD